VPLIGICHEDRGKGICGTFIRPGSDRPASEYADRPLERSSFPVGQKTLPRLRALNGVGRESA